MVSKKKYNTFIYVNLLQSMIFAKCYVTCFSQKVTYESPWGVSISDCGYSHQMPRAYGSQ